MPKHLKELFTATLLLSLALAMPLRSSAAAAADDDEPINLSPVKKGSTKPEDAAPAAVATQAPTLAPTAMAVATPTLVPTLTPKPKPIKKLAHIEGLSTSQDDSGLTIKVEANLPMKGKVSLLKNPDRILVSFNNASLPGRKMTKTIGQGAAVAARLAQHPNDEVWLVIDLDSPVAHTVKAGGSGFSIHLDTAGAAAAPASSRRVADLPKIDLMFFDLNVLFQGKQYDRFPCANFIYDKTDNFPLKREFISTLVFHEGYGAFVGNLRIVDPRGGVIDHTKEPIAFNLFSELFDYSAEVPWKIEFPEKGFYSLVLTLNGEDVLVHRFYVGHNDDKPAK